MRGPQWDSDRREGSIKPCVTHTGYMNDRQEDDSMSYSGDKWKRLGVKRFVMRTSARRQGAEQPPNRNRQE